MTSAHSLRGHCASVAADLPNALKSFEQAQSVLNASSAKTPKIEREPDAPGGMNTVLSALDRRSSSLVPDDSSMSDRARKALLTIIL